MCHSAARLSQAVYSQALDPADFASTTSSEIALPPGCKHRQLIETHIAAIAEAVVQCATFLPTKSSVYVSLVGVWAIDMTRLPLGVSLADVEISVKVDPTDDAALERRAKADEAKARRIVLSCLTKEIVRECHAKLGEALDGGKLAEATQLLRFLMGLASLRIVELVRE